MCLGYYLINCPSYSENNYELLLSMLIAANYDISSIIMVIDELGFETYSDKYINTISINKFGKIVNGNIDKYDKYIIDYNNLFI